MHAALEAQGAYRVQAEGGGPKEWFEATLEEVQRAYSFVRTGGHSGA